jgi:hypothetical protein
MILSDDAKCRRLGRDVFQVGLQELAPPAVPIHEEHVHPVPGILVGQGFSIGEEEANYIRNPTRPCLIETSTKPCPSGYAARRAPQSEDKPVDFKLGHYQVFGKRSEIPSGQSEVYA